MLDTGKYNFDYLKIKAPDVFTLAKRTQSLDGFRTAFQRLVDKQESEAFSRTDALSEGSVIRVRDCARALRGIFTSRSDSKSGFSVATAIRDLARGNPRPDLTPGFYAELLHMFLGMQGRGPGRSISDAHLLPSKAKGRKAAIERSKQLDELSAEIYLRSDRISSGLNDDAAERRAERKKHILKKLKATEKNWNDWHWQTAHIIRKAGQLQHLVILTESERNGIEEAVKNSIPFGITPYYLSLMDDDPEAGRDRAVRAQVFPPPSYVEKMSDYGGNNTCMDFMRETDTSPVNLITRRYPGICILKPFNTCPQICVYCQRNWEIDDAMLPNALASEKEIKAALEWIKKHPAIHEVLVTGGDPLAMPDKALKRTLDGLANITSVERIRIGSRVPVTLPMRIDAKLADLLASYRMPGKREVAVVTHIQHPYELTKSVIGAITRLRAKGISIYNQLVYTFFVSRRFEAALLRRQLVRIGVEPYYTFNTKGKDETLEYRVPIARLLQEQKEEARLLPGLARTDEAVFNVPGQGKNYLRAAQHRDLISIKPNGARVYEFHPWEKQISDILETYIGDDVPILDYLKRLDRFGEDITDYGTIWYYF